MHCSFTGKKQLATTVLIFLHGILFGQCNNIYQKLWGTTNGSPVNAAAAVLTAQNNLLVCGQVGAGGGILKFSPAQTLLWSKVYLAGGFSTNFKRIISHSDGGIAAAGYMYEGTKSPFCVVKFDGSGTVTWTKRFLDTSQVPGLTLRWSLIEALAETPDGGLVISGRKVYLRPNNNTNYRTFIFKLNVDGSLAWTREDTSGNDDDLFGMQVAQGAIYVVGRTHVPSAGGIGFGFIEKINPVDGSILFLKLYRFPGITSHYFRSIEKTAGGFEIGTQCFPAFGVRLYHSFKIDYDGNEVELIKMPEPVPGLNLLDQFYHPVPLPNGGTALWKNWYHSSTDAALARINSDRTSTWYYDYPIAEKQTLYQVLANPDNTVMMVGASPDPAIPSSPNQLLLSRISQDGSVGLCVAQNQPFPIKDSLHYQIINASWINTQLSFEAPFTVTTTQADIQLVEQVLCSGSNCSVDTMKITGDTVICTPGAIVNYKAAVAGNCTAPVSWALVPPIGNVTQLNDSSIQIQFTTAGNALLSASVATACFSANTAVSLHYIPSAVNVNLGADTSFCEGDTIRLSVSNIFPHILWNNNATVSSIPVYNPGTYYVQVSADSVCFIRDTISIIQNQLPVVRLGNYQYICNPGPLLLNAGGGYNAYLWQDGNSSPVYSVTVPGSYWVTVTDNNRCSANSDTVNIIGAVEKPQHFAIFTDTTVCFGKTVVLKLINNYNSYNWNNGLASTPALSVSTAGTYKIEVTDNNGCKGSDTILVREKACLQQIYVPNAFTPNTDGLNDNFKPVFFGQTDFFEMTVYNRYGQLVYQTSDKDKGWSGNFLSVLQPAGNYVWYIRYRFLGLVNIESLTGNVLLIR